MLEKCNMRVPFSRDQQHRWISLYDLPDLLWVKVEANSRYDQGHDHGLPGIVLDLTGSGRYSPPYQENAYLRPLPGSDQLRADVQNLSGTLTRGDVAIIHGDIRFTKWRAYLLDAVKSASSCGAIVLVGLAGNRQFPLNAVDRVYVEEINRHANIVMMEATLTASDYSCSDLLKYLANDVAGQRILSELLSIHKRGPFLLASGHHLEGGLEADKVAFQRLWAHCQGLGLPLAKATALFALIRARRHKRVDEEANLSRLLYQWTKISSGRVRMHSGLEFSMYAALEHFHFIFQLPELTSWSA